MKQTFVYTQVCGHAHAHNIFMFTNSTFLAGKTLVTADLSSEFLNKIRILA